jgi:hypothetical protein
MAPIPRSCTSIPKLERRSQSGSDSQETRCEPSDHRMLGVACQWTGCPAACLRECESGNRGDASIFLVVSEVSLPLFGGECAPSMLQSSCDQDALTLGLETAPPIHGTLDECKSIDLPLHQTGTAGIDENCLEVRILALRPFSKVRRSGMPLSRAAWSAGQAALTGGTSPP